MIHTLSFELEIEHSDQLHALHLAVSFIILLDRLIILYYKLIHNPPFFTEVSNHIMCDSNRLEGLLLMRCLIHKY